MSTAAVVAPRRSPLRRGFGLLFGLILLVLAGPVGVAGGALAFFSAAISGSVIVMCLLALAVCLGITLALARAGARRVAPARWRAVAWALSGAITLAFAVSAWMIFFQPLATPARPASLPAGAAYCLSEGARPGHAPDHSCSAAARWPGRGRRVYDTLHLALQGASRGRV
jgi:hypothetical protein